MDFERRIAAIYQKCRTQEQIQFEFDQLRKELEMQVAEGQRDAREKLLNNFDQEVVEKVRIQSHDFLDRFTERLWLVTRYLLAPYARFEEGTHSFWLTRNPFPNEAIHPGPYRMGKKVGDANTYRVGHPLARRVLEQGMALETTPREVVFDYSGSGKIITIIEPLVGQSGWLTCTRFSVIALEAEDHQVFAGVTDSGELLDDAQCRRLFDLPGKEHGKAVLPAQVAATLEEAAARRRQQLLDEMTEKNGRWFDIEMDKLDRWADDRRSALKAELDELDQSIKETKRSGNYSAKKMKKVLDSVFGGNCQNHKLRATCS